jgi:amino-acid N-acetyltransferase
VSTTLRPAAPEDLGSVLRLLAEAGLPADGIPASLAHFWVADQDGDCAGIAGIELYADGALLRSVAVMPSARGSGVGRALTDRAIDGARAAGARDVFLLTTTAERYFGQIGFARIGRDQVPASVRESVEFRGACPASAAVMRMSVDPRPLAR